MIMEYTIMVIEHGKITPRTYDYSDYPLGSTDDSIKAIQSRLMNAGYTAQELGMNA